MSEFKVINSVKGADAVFVDGENPDCSNVGIEAQSNLYIFALLPRQHKILICFSSSY